MAMRTEIPRLMTEEEFESWCDEDTRAEFVDGVIVEMSPVSAVHDDLFHFLARLLGNYLEVNPVGRVRGPEFQVRLRAGLRRVPDLLFVSAEKTHTLRRTYLDGAPDAAFEIVSPESVDRDRREKLAEYEAAGVIEYWVVDPAYQVLHLYRIGPEGKYAPVAEEAGWLSSIAIPGFRMRPAWLWQEPLPRVLDCLREAGVSFS
ncbi:MAG: Uma2 family endonuclease [Armatimonadota bacterium]